jgi:V/A-type H+-transporting ATPase subunit E
MNSETQLEQLEKAIQLRAQSLVDSHLQTAKQQREKILEESARRLVKREERENELAKAAAEQEYRRRVQASEIKMQAELDKLRWILVQAVVSHLQKQLKSLREKSTSYVELLKQYLIHAANLLEDDELVVEVNNQDHLLLSPQWEAIINDCVPDKRCHLSASAQSFSGGLLVRNQEDRIRIDNTFEGLIARLENKLHETITAQLFASAIASTRV